MMMDTAIDDSPEPLHVFDLPQLYQKPPAAVLLETLDHLAITPPSWDTIDRAPNNSNRAIPKVYPDGLTKYLTSIIASPLTWLPDDALRDQIWELASIRLSERSGRTAQPPLTRTFTLSLPTGNKLEITLHEPTLTSDNLGHKTWSASHLLARRLPLVLPHLPTPKPRTLELGAGTGLLGIAAACVLGTAVHLTDLPDILPNLARNVEVNATTIAKYGGSATTGVLDWAADTGPTDGEERKYEVILIADPVYAPEHPGLVCGVVERWLWRDGEARVVVEVPLREGYRWEVEALQKGLEDVGLRCLEEGVEGGRDDWGTRGGEVRCQWSVWGWGGWQGDTAEATA